MDEHLEPQDVESELQIRNLQNKKQNKLNKSFILTFLIFIGVIIVGYFYIYDIPGESPSEEVISPPTTELNLVDESIEEVEDNVKLTSPVEDNQVFRRTNLENPRLSIVNKSGDEVIGLDHNGTIAAVDIFLDENVNITGNATGRYAFFSFVGDILNIVTKSWFTDVVTGDLNATGNVTLEGIKFEVDSSNHRIYDNGTCIIMTGDTSTFQLC